DPLRTTGSISLNMLANHRFLAADSCPARQSRCPGPAYGAHRIPRAGGIDDDAELLPAREFAYCAIEDPVAIARARGERGACPDVDGSKIVNRREGRANDVFRRGVEQHPFVVFVGGKGSSAGYRWKNAARCPWCCCHRLPEKLKKLNAPPSR